MISTGPITTWDIDPTEVGPMYPYAGSELLMFMACAAFCIFFLIWKFKTEHDKYVTKAKRLQEPGELEKALSDDPVDSR